MNKKERELLLKTEFNCVKGDDILFRVNKDTFRGKVIDLVPKHEFPSDYFPEKVPDSRNKCYMWQDQNGLSISSVLLCVMTGKKRNLPTYYTTIRIIQKIDK